MMAERWWAGAALVNLRFLVEGGLGGAESLVLLFEAALESDDALAGTEAGVELVTVEGLGDEIVSAGVHPGHYVFLLRFVSNDDDVGVAAVRQGADSLDELKPVHFRHVPIADDEGERFGLKALPGLGTVGCRDDFVAPLLQVVLQEAAGDGVVFGDEELH